MWRTRPTIAVLLAVAAIEAHGSSRSPVPERAPGFTRIVEHEDEKSVIVEFRARPLLSVPAQTSRESAARRLADSFARLESDLRRLGERHITGRSTSVPEIRWRYSLSFAGASVRVPPAMVSELARLEYVARVLPDHRYEANLEASVPHIGAPDAWEIIGSRGEGVTVAILDTGIAHTHEAFGGTFGPGSRVVGGYDFVNDDDDPMDDNGHGTHVAGIVGGNGGGVVGVAPGVTFLAYKVLNESGAGFASGIIAAIERSVDPNNDGDTRDRADVANMSLGGPVTPDDPISRAVDNATAAGTLFVVASGNNGRFFGVGSPATAASALSVGASERDQDVLANFSSRGPAPGTGALKPEVVAPGVNITSAAHGGGLLRASGTSMAAPHVAGVAALVAAAHPGWAPSDIKSAIVTSSRELENEVMAAGAGRVDAAAAVTTAILAQPSAISFGVDDLALESWTTSRTVSLRNTSANPVTLTATASGTADGIELVVDPASVTLGPLQTQSVTVRLTVSNDAFPDPTEGSLSFGGQVSFEGGGARLHVPWAFVKAARARIRLGEEDFYELLLSSTVHDQFLIGVSSEFDVIVPPGDYEIVVQGTFGAGDSRLVILEEQPIRALDTLDVRGDSATTELLLDTRDQSGAPLARDGRMCVDVWMLLLPEGSRFGWFSFVSFGPLAVTPASDRYTLLPMQMCTSEDRSDLWLGEHEPIRDFGGDVVSTILPDRWRTQPVRIDVPDGLPNPWLLMAGLLAYRPIESAGYSGFAHTFPLDGPRWEGSVHFTSSSVAHAGSAALFDLLVDPPGTVSEPGDRPFASELAYETPLLRPIGEVLVPSTDESASPVNYVPQPDETLHFGRDPMYPVTLVSARDDQLRAFVFWSGGLEEFRADVVFGQENRITRPGGETTEGPGTGLAVPLEEGAYTVESRIPVVVGGITGEQRLTATLDRSREDSLPPRFTMLRVRDGAGRVATHVSGAASLEFSAADLMSDGNDGILGAGVPPETVRVQARVHGTSEWSDLAVTHLGDDAGTLEELGRLATGSAFVVDLAGMTETGGPIDVRIELADASGNTLQLVTAPAFVVHGDRRRPSRK